MGEKDRSASAPRLVAWSLAGLSLVASALIVVLGIRQGQPVSLTEPLLPVVYPLVGALIASRHPRNAVGWTFIGIGLLDGVSVVAGDYAKLGLFHDASEAGGEFRGTPRPDPLPLAAEATWIESWTWVPAFLGLVTFVPALFPTGRPATPRWRWVVWVAVAGIALAIVPVAVASWPVRGVRLSGDIASLPELRWTTPFAAAGFALAGLGALGAVASLVARYRRSQGAEREQLKWFVFAAGVLFVAAANAFTPWSVPESVLSVALQGIAVATGIAILRHRLYDIDVVINRSLVYGALTAAVVVTYAGTVTLFDRLLRRTGLGVSVFATGLVAVLFQPARVRLQRGVNRLMFGDRDDPHAAVARLGRRLEASLAPAQLLPSVAETVAQALRLPYVAIELAHEGEMRIAAAHGKRSGEPVSLPLVYRGETVGRLAVAPRAGEQTLSPADRRTLEDLARQTSAAAHVARLTTDLQRSRERLVAAREEERRRLRRELHDGLGPTFAAIGMEIEAARSLIASDPARAEQILDGLGAKAQSAIADIRRIVYGLRPPALDELGLVGAIHEHVRRLTGDGALEITVDAPAGVDGLPAAVEVAAFRIAVEAIMNTSRHSGARSCRVRLAHSDALEIEVTDDGAGLPPEVHAGVGFTSMRERAEELGGAVTLGPSPSGGVRVHARLPIAQA